MSDIGERHDLVVIHEEDRALGTADEFHDLVLAKIAVEPALGIQAMCFIDDKRVEHIGFCVMEAARA
ncbi:hypothetical protein D9M68_899130 [compost metagenome]